MPTPDTQGVPPFADFEMLKSKINEIVQKYNNLLVNLDSLNVVSITANSTTITSNLSGGAYIRLDGNGMVINDGTQDTFSVDINGNVVMTSATVQSAAGYPKVVMDPTGDLFGAYASAIRSIIIGADLAGFPYLQFSESGTNIDFTYTTGGGLNISSNGDISLNTGDVFLYPSNLVHLLSWSDLYNDGALESLQDALNEKANRLSSTGSAGSANGGIPIGTVLMVSGGGTVTWNGIPAHTHTQT